ncbi:NAD-dependent epimerase/dehydratase family protein [Piscinibacter terrae]|uniref:NAD-dependent epimerase/dehydratase family protein n=1 Tax=Piscinibacter terrae TaxID=2496871 RepID=A0A3N7HJ70_9BURK|nr:NAD-dependent epimerase/dehydratase family protein [Albitalea terrae]RQP22097.1 NAD-dependent epimerase/dehydratase family protein [Albitalea terrae]
MTQNTFWQNRNVFVTGASGFLGSWVTSELNKRGANVVGLVRDVSKTGKDSLIPGAGLNFTVFGALEDLPLLTRAINEYEIDTVLHLGAQPIVGIANRNPVSTFEANIRGSWNLLEACRQVSTVKRIVVASSDKAYGEQPKLPYDEGMPLQGMHPYDVSKSCTDLISQTYHNTYGTPVCITRCGNFFGGGDLNFSRIVPGTIRSVAEGKRPVIRSDGTLIRDYVYVRDVALFYLHLAEAMENKDIHGHAFNYSTESQLTVLDITRLILKLMKSDLQPEVLNEAKGEIPHQYLSSAKAREMLRWSSHITIEEGLKETIDWYLNYFRGTQAA